MKKIYFLLGYPGSGLKELTYRMEDEMKCLPVYILHTDSVDEAVKKVKDAMHVNFYKRKDVVICGYLGSEKTRKKLFSVIPNLYEKIGVTMNRTKVECLETYRKEHKLKKKEIPFFLYDMFMPPLVNEFDRIIPEDKLF